MNKNIYMIIVFILCLRNIVAEDTILKWNDTIKISKKDFLEDKCDGKYAARLYWKISLDMNYVENYLYLDLGCFMNCNKSSYCIDEDSSLTAHEFLHFKIAELYARKIRRRMSKIKTKDANRIIKEIRIIHKEECENCNKVQELYDLETNHGIVDLKQIEWKEKIDKELEKLSKYKDTIVKLKIKR